MGASTALATPLFPVIGLNQLLFRYASPELRVALTGGASLLQFSLMTLVPNAFYYAPLLLPFALGNGLTAAAAYLVVEAGAGGPAALSRWAAGPIPVAGPLLGIIVALAAPLTYPSAFSVVWPGRGGGGIGLSDELFGPGSLSYLDLVYNRVALPCLATTGAISGALLHVGLQPVILGRPGVPGPYLAGAVLGAVGACPSSARPVNDRLLTLGGRNRRRPVRRLLDWHARRRAARPRGAARRAPALWFLVVVVRARGHLLRRRVGLALLARGARRGRERRL